MWQTTETKHMVPSHQDVTALEQKLARPARSQGGKADGWGRFILKDSK